MSKQFPIVLRMAGWNPAELGKFIHHFYRQGKKKLDNVDYSRSWKNTVSVGNANFNNEFLEELKEVSRANKNNKVAGLRACGRKKQAEEAEELGLIDPWKKPAKTGPLREIILTANKDYFDGDEADVILGETTRKELFEASARAFIEEHFAEEEILFFGTHDDEEAFHIHAIVAPWSEKTTKTTGLQKTLKPSGNKLIQDYEKAQDAAGEWFTDIGLVRGKKDPSRKNVKPHIYRMNKAEEKVKKLEDAVYFGAECLEKEMVQYNPPKGDKPEGLKTDKNAPKDPKQIKQMFNRIRPARDLIIKAAKVLAEAKKKMLEKMRQAEESVKERIQNFRDLEEKQKQQGNMLEDRANAINARAETVKVKELSEWRKEDMQHKQNQRQLVR